MFSHACNQAYAKWKPSLASVQVFGCRKKMSAIAIMDYSGADELFKQMLALAAAGQLAGAIELDVTDVGMFYHL